MECNALIILKHRGTLIDIEIQRIMIPMYFIYKTISILKLSARQCVLQQKILKAMLNNT